MGLFDHFPYTNVHELNLDWLLTMMKALEAEWDAFTAGNSLTFADPLQHDMSKTYAKNTIVIDGSGNAYVSLQAVPVGVGLGDQDYWLMVFDYEAFIEKVNKNFTARYYRGSYRATAAMAIGDWLTVDDVLYKATAAIAADDVLEDGVNITHFTLEDFIKAFMQSANQLIQQYKNDIDASELLYRQQLAQDIADTTASLQAQLDLAISGATVDSEVINARVGEDGITYPTLGDAIRGQFKETSDTDAKNLAWFTDTTDRTINGLDVTFNDDGTVTFSGTTNAATYLFFRGATAISDDNLSAGTYSFTREIVSGSGNVRIVNDGTNIISGNDAYMTATQTLVNNGRIYLYIGNGIAINGTYKFQIESSSTATEFAPAFNMTSLDLISRYNISQIKNTLSQISDIFDETIESGKNLAWLTDYSDRNINGVDFKFNDDGSFYASGTTTATTYIYMRGATSNTANLTAGTYTITREILSGSGNIRVTNNGTNVLSTADTGKVIVTFTDTNNPHIYLSIGNNVTIDGLFRFQIESGSASTDYVPPFNLTAVDKLARFYSKDNYENSFIKYRFITTTLAQGGTDRIQVLLNNSIRWDLVHSADIGINCDLWRILGINKAGPDFSFIQSLTGSGEFEFAFKLSGLTHDYIGGYIHGDEIETSMSCYADGVLIPDITQVTNYLTAKEFIIIRNTTMYDDLDTSRAVCTHGCKYIFTPDGLTIEQGVTWLVDDTIDTAYLAMFPVAKSVTDSYFDNITCVEQALTSTNYSLTLDAVDDINIFGSDVKCDFYITDYPDLTGGNVALISDNGGNSYNKCYYRVCNNATVTTGDIWRSKTHYKIHI